MFEVGFTELILICGLALIVLGPERLPGLAAQIGRWVGRARAMARQLRDQLDQEVNLKQEPWRQRPSTPSSPEPDDDNALYPEGRSHQDAGEDAIDVPPASAPSSATPADARASAAPGDATTTSDPSTGHAPASPEPASGAAPSSDESSTKTP